VTRGVDGPALDMQPAEGVRDRDDVAGDEVRALTAIARLDLEAAAAFGLAADSVEDARLRRMLHAFRDDHRRHVDAIVGFSRAKGMEIHITPIEAERSPFVAIASSVGALDPRAAVEAVIGNELLTNATYDTAGWLISDSGALTIVRRHCSKERDHLDALTRWAHEHEQDPEDD
jgi:hypothetical protein